jgi:hypothetical protein
MLVLEPAFATDTAELVSVVTFTRPFVARHAMVPARAPNAFVEHEALTGALAARKRPDVTVTPARPVTPTEHVNFAATTSDVGAGVPELNGGANFILPIALQRTSPAASNGMNRADAASTQQHIATTANTTTNTARPTACLGPRLIHNPRLLFVAALAADADEERR